jgi:ABC-type sugar transport system permease subunit
MYIYKFIDGSNAGSLSVAAAASLVLFAIILLLTLVQMQVSKKRVHY